MVAEAAFLTTWGATDFWTLLVLPHPDSVTPPLTRQGDTGNPDDALVVQSGDRCDALVSQGVGLAHAGDYGAADVTLSAALAQCPASALAARELAGLRFVQSRWDEAAQLAAVAAAQTPDDAPAWRLLAASRFILGDLEGALRAWNRIGEPRIDLVRVDGLDRTFQTVVRDLLGLSPRTELTVAALRRAHHSIALLPAASATRVGYRPIAGGLAEIVAAVVERPRFPGPLGTRRDRRTRGDPARDPVRCRHADGRRRAAGFRMALVARAAAPWTVTQHSVSVRALRPLATGRIQERR